MSSVAARNKVPRIGKGRSRRAAAGSRHRVYAIRGPSGRADFKAVQTTELARAYQAGKDSGQDALFKERSEGTARSQDHFRASLSNWFGSQTSGKRPPFAHALALGYAYRDGYAAARSKRPQTYGVPVPLSGTASVVITACNEEKTIGSLLDELERLPLSEKIVVLNGCTDGSFAEVKSRKNVIMAYFPKRLGHDVGRSVGAALASGDSVLFVDGDMAVPAEELAAFLYERENGTDVVLNDISAYLPLYASQDEVTRCKLFLNQALGRPDLKSNSMTAVPHALSRKAIDIIGTEMLTVPPKAQAVAIIERLTVSAPCTTDVIGRNRLREGNYGAGNNVALLILGDHVEALNEAVRRKGSRLFWETAPRPQLAKARNRQ